MTDDKSALNLVPIKYHEIDNFSCILKEILNVYFLYYNDHLSLHPTQTCRVSESLRQTYRVILAGVFTS